MTTINTSTAPILSQDVFADIMSWNSVPPSPLSSGSQIRSTRSFYSVAGQPADYQTSEPTPDMIRHPFGRGVVFESPACHSSTHLTSPPALREVQSFESGLTARATDAVDASPKSVRTGKQHARLPDESLAQVEEETISAPDTPVVEAPKFEALAENHTLSLYSTDLFDVLQNYKGLPVIDSIATDPNQATIRLSLRAEESAAPRDDPRFVIWGEASLNDDEEAISPQRSTAELSSHSAASGRSKASPESMPHLHVSSGDISKRILAAATIERWIAQLTSELNYDELLIFFLTYRTYISPLDLGYLLICRFHWALSQPTSTHDEMVRRIVRVRTFIAIRYWLLTFFNVDFVPNLELRVAFANWLNDLRKDSVLARHKDAMVSKLAFLVHATYTYRETSEHRYEAAQGRARLQGSVHARY
jgi:Gdp/GTP exchange factor required for growth at low temperatures